MKFTIAMGNAAINIEDLSKLSGVSRNTIYRIRNEKLTPRTSTIGKLAKALNVKVEDLI